MSLLFPPTLAERRQGRAALRVVIRTLSSWWSSLPSRARPELTEHLVQFALLLSVPVIEPSEFDALLEDLLLWAQRRGLGPRADALLEQLSQTT